MAEKCRDCGRCQSDDPEENGECQVELDERLQEEL